MSKKNKNGYGKGSFIESSILLSPAWMSLGRPGTSKTVSSCSCQMLSLLLLKRQFGDVKDRNGKKKKQRTDDNRFTLTYKELMSFGISQKMITRAIDELLAKGFIDIIDPGGAYNKHKAVYALVEDFKRWRPGDPPVKERSRDVYRGYQKPKN